ncbi:beta-galactosidase trimerization domain-containing protein [Streptomyces luteogriseus]
MAARGTVLATFLSGRVDDHDRAVLTDVPGPLAPLLGIRVDEWGARPPEFAQTVPELGAQTRLVFEIVLPRGAGTVATYGSDFYADTPAVTRDRYGLWRGLVRRHRPRPARGRPGRSPGRDLLGPCADHPAVETATRVAPDGTRLFFLLNHAPEPTRLTAHATVTDLLTGKRTGQGELPQLDPLGVAILQ